ncbi:archaellin/type IV pilin N-terminal domain-containing protein [archaeon]
MRKGISPIVSVVLLIAISVISAVSLYFWVGGLATKQATPERPIVINAQTYRCTLAASDSMTVLIQNLDASATLDNVSQPLRLLDDNLEIMIATTAPDIGPGGQEAWTFEQSTAAAAELTKGVTYIIYGAGTGQATVVC